MALLRKTLIWAGIGSYGTATSYTAGTLGAIPPKYFGKYIEKNFRNNV
jgi:hypothetical protein